MTTRERNTETPNAVVADQPILHDMMRFPLNPLRLEGVPQRRGADQRKAAQMEVEEPTREVLSFERIRDLVGALDAGPNMAYRVARAVEHEVLALTDAHDLLEVVRTVAMVAHMLNFRPRPTKKNPAAMPVDAEHPLYHASPMVQAARKLCERHGYHADGQSSLGRQVQPEELLLARERGEKDYMHTYRYLLGEARRAGFDSVHEAIAATMKGPTHG